MHKITSDRLTNLLTKEITSPAVTIYLPSHRYASPPNMTEDQIRFKNLARKAIAELESHDKHDDFIQEFREHAQQLMDTPNFWENLTESLLICASPGMFEYYHLPIDSEEYVSVDDHFHLTPVIGLVSDMSEYYVLTVSQQQPTLFKGDMYELKHEGLELPKTIEEALNIDELQKQDLQFNVTRAPKGAMFHGHGGSKDMANNDRHKFFRLIDSMVCYEIDTKLPLILAGTENEIAEYSEHTQHPNILNSHIEGSYNSDDFVKLHKQALRIMQDEIISKNHEEALEQFSRMNGQSPERTSTDLEALENAAETGKVDTLLVGMSRKTRDTVRDNMDEVPKLVFPAEKDNQRVDHIARQVFTQSGKIVNLFQDQMPEQKLALAINRY